MKKLVLALLIMIAIAFTVASCSSSRQCPASNAGGAFNM